MYRACICALKETDPVKKQQLQEECRRATIAAAESPAWKETPIYLRLPSQPRHNASSETNRRANLVKFRELKQLHRLRCLKVLGLAEEDVVGVADPRISAPFHYEKWMIDILPVKKRPAARTVPKKSVREFCPQGYNIEPEDIVNDGKDVLVTPRKRRADAAAESTYAASAKRQAGLRMVRKILSAENSEEARAEAALAFMASHDEEMLRKQQAAEAALLREREVMRFRYSSKGISRFFAVTCRTSFSMFRRLVFSCTWTPCARSHHLSVYGR